MKYRKLRIAWSVGCGILCLLLIVLWVRSYQKMRHVSIPIVTQVLSFDANRRLLIISLRPDSVRRPDNSIFFLKHYYPTFRIQQAASGGLVILMRPWIAVSAMGLVTVLPWIHWPKQFSLRTLLIATTVVAVVLGLIIYASR